MRHHGLVVCSSTEDREQSSARRRSTKKKNRLIEMVPWWWYTYRCRSNGRQVAEVIVGTNQAHFRSCVALRGIIHVEAWERLNRFGGRSKECVETWLEFFDVADLE